MSLKVKLSLTIAGLLLIVMILCLMMWELNQYRNNMKMLQQSTQIIAVEVNQLQDLEDGIDAHNLQSIYQSLKSEIPFLTGLIVKTPSITIKAGDPSSILEIEEHIFSSEDELINKIYNIKEANWKGNRIYIGEYYDEIKTNTAIYVIYDKTKFMIERKQANDYFSAYLVLIFIGAVIIYLLVIMRILRPLKDILWKVNEVSLVKLQKTIPITTNDELSVLSHKINTMSQNLNIYMNKLKNSFDENRRMNLYVDSIINHATDAVYIMDTTGRVIQVNKAFEELFGYISHEIVGHRHLIVPEHLVKEKDELINRLLQGLSVEPLETYRRTKFGELVPVSTNINPIVDVNQQLIGFINVCRDMRHRHRMEEIIRRAEKLNTVGQLAAGVAHEIRNPLTTLRGFLQLQKQTEKIHVEHIEVMLSELDRINLIVGEFLILSKPQAVKFKKRDVREIINEVCVFMNSEALMHNVILKENYTLDDCSIPCEENQLKQVFINVLKNSIEAMPQGGYIHLSIQRNQQHVAVTVTDEGKGMEDEVLSRIGDPFFTAKENGTGLGIMVSQKIIQAHSGQMEISSQVNVGTIVKVILPIQDNIQYTNASNL